MLSLVHSVRWVWALAMGASACVSDSGPADLGPSLDLATLLDQGVLTDVGFRPDASGLDAAAPEMGVPDTGPADTGVADTGPADQGVTCTYPSGSVEPMALNEILTPYRWASAFDGARNALDFDLSKVFCNTDEDMDWSPFDVLLFISIPAW